MFRQFGQYANVFFLGADGIDIKRFHIINTIVAARTRGDIETREIVEFNYWLMQIINRFNIG